MRRAYRWRCFACDGANAASATSCSSCGFPASASGAEIARGRAAWRGGAVPVPAPESRPRASLPRPMAGWAGWQMAVAVAGAVLFAVGAFAGREALSWRGLGVAIFALMFGLLMLMVAVAGRNAMARA